MQAKRASSLWGQIDTEFAARSLPTGQGDTWDNKEEF
jgi:hypothetical protein